jgi:N-acetylglucosaminyldiphosphoundecaprenol N-acetyl-beta-D-mannosaminyltransferase
MRMVTADQVFAAARSILTGEVVGAHGGAPPSGNAPRFKKQIEILDLPVSAITYREWLELIDAWVKSDQTHHVCTINPEMIMIARRDPNFYHILSRADLTVPDGVGLLWAARRLGTPLPERVTGSDGVPLIAQTAAERGWRIYLLGAAPGVADKAAAVLRKRHPALQIVGTYSGSPAPGEEDAIVERVNASGADILFVAFGAPNQDKWIARNLPRLCVKMAMGVGGSLDFVAGVLPRAPELFQRFGLEWLYRLYLQPWRIGRMLRLPRFVLAVLLDKDR